MRQSRLLNVDFATSSDNEVIMLEFQDNVVEA